MSCLSPSLCVQLPCSACSSKDGPGPAAQTQPAWGKSFVLCSHVALQHHYPVCTHAQIPDPLISFVRTSAVTCSPQAKARHQSTQARHIKASVTFINPRHISQYHTTVSPIPSVPPILSYTSQYPQSGRQSETMSLPYPSVQAQQCVQTLWVPTRVEQALLPIPHNVPSTKQVCATGNADSATCPALVPLSSCAQDHLFGHAEQ